MFLVGNAGTVSNVYVSVVESKNASEICVALIARFSATFAGQYASPVGGNPAALEPPQGYQQPPVVGAPYALPEMSESPKDVIVPSQETLDLDKVQTTSTVTPVPPATNATAAAAGGETGNQCHVAAHSIDDVKTLAAKPKRLRCRCFTAAGDFGRTYSLSQKCSGD